MQTFFDWSAVFFHQRWNLNRNQFSVEVDVNIDDESGNTFNTYSEEEMETDNPKSYCFDEGGKYFG